MSQGGYTNKGLGVGNYSTLIRGINCTTHSIDITNGKFIHAPTYNCIYYIVFHILPNPRLINQKDNNIKPKTRTCTTDITAICFIG